MDSIKGSLSLSIILYVLLIKDTLNFTISFPNGGQSTDSYTLTSNVEYLMNATFPSSTTVPAGSYVTLQFLYRYNITASTLTNCRYSTNNASYTSTSCTVQSTGSSTATIYTVRFPDVFPATMTNQSGINLAVLIT